MNILIGYYDYYSDTYEYSRHGKNKGNLYITKKPNEIEKFFSTNNSCPFCKTPLKKVFNGCRTCTLGTTLYLNGKVYECPNCNWWTYKSHFSDSTDHLNEIHSVCTDKNYYAICQKYNITDKSLPLNLLLNELPKNMDLLYNINPYKLEELTQHILKGVFNCEVHHVGRTGDGGTDLIVLDSDNPILVQVKRRENPKHVELVKGIREFVGTLFIEGKEKGIYVSTAERFSKGSTDVANNLIQSRKLSYFEFVNYDKLCSLIRQHGATHSPWEQLVKEFYLDKNTIIHDNKSYYQKDI